MNNVQSSLVSFFFKDNFPPVISGSDTFRINLNEISTYVINVTDPGDTFEVMAMSNMATAPALTLTEGLQNGLYFLNINLTNAMNGFTFSVLATDSIGANSTIQPQVDFYVV